MSTDAITVVAVKDRRQKRAFLDVPGIVNAGDPAWITPLRMVERERLDRKRHPFFRYGEAEFFVAWRGGRAVGRISAQINRLYLERHNDSTGHFGLLQADEDPAVVTALMRAAEDWVAARGLRRLAGPFSLSINEESGLLIDGFDTPPIVMMGHNGRHLPARLEENGYGEDKRLLAYLWDLTQPLPDRLERSLVNANVRYGKRLTIRPFDLSRLDREIGVVVDIFNDAWKDNWGFVPFTKYDVESMARDLKPLLVAEGGQIAEWDGEPIAMLVGLPDLNEAIADLDGRLLPLGWLKLLYRLKVKKPTGGRVALMGVREAWRGKPQGAVAVAIMLDRVRRVAQKLGVRRVEYSWILEDNQAIRGVIEALGLTAYKTYAIYGKSIAPNPMNSVASL